MAETETLRITGAIHEAVQSAVPAVSAFDERGIQ